MLFCHLLPVFFIAYCGLKRFVIVINKSFIMLFNFCGFAYEKPMSVIVNTV